MKGKNCVKKLSLRIDGMTCSACSSGLEKYLLKQKGIHDASVNLVLSLVTVLYDNLSQKEIETFISNAGFQSLGEYKKVNELENTQGEKRKIFIYGIFLLFFLYLSMSSMWNLPQIPWFNPQHPVLFATLQLFFSFLFLSYGFSILKSGFKNLIHRMPNMDTLVMFSVMCSFLYSLYGYFKIIQGNTEILGNLYFESVCMVIYFIELGKWIEKGTINSARSAIQKLVQITPQTARIKRQDQEQVVSLDEVKKGDIVICKPGEIIAVDGLVVDGKTHVDESFITGESKPVLKEMNHSVIAGSQNYEGYLEYVAQKVGKESTISSIVTLIMEATGSKNKIQKIADKISGIFVPVIFVLAILTFGIQSLLGFSIQESLTHMVTILVVACPCALGLAVPLVVVISNSLCAERGLFLKNGEVLELGRTIETIVFDKTGTLTYGKLNLFQLFNYSDYSDEEVLNLVANLEQKSSHPIHTAFSVTKPFEVCEFETLEGRGISGVIHQKRYYVGNASFVLDKTNYRDDEEYLVQHACSLVYVLEEEQVIALIGVRDIIREHVSLTVKELKKQNIEVVMLTGDNQTTAEMIAKEVGITHVIAEVLPTEKNEKIEQFIRDGKHVMMVGDGINDAPALVTSTIGVSIHSGVDIALDASDIILMNNDIQNLLDFFLISRLSYKMMKQNLFWAFLYNVCMIPIAMGLFQRFGLVINPMLGSIAMTLSSITVVFNSLRLRRMIHESNITN